ncbi:MAG: monovalent cation/H(+) antiporter subunit G [Candidatus Thiodiazotropha sp.]
MLIGLLSDLCLLFGGLLCLTGGVGLLRLPSFFVRLHAASVTETLATVFLIAGVMLDTGWALDTAKLLLLIVIMFVANPSITHALCRTAAHGKYRPESNHEPQASHQQENQSSNNSTS